MRKFAKKPSRNYEAEHFGKTQPHVFVRDSRLTGFCPSLGESACYTWCKSTSLARTYRTNVSSRGLFHCHRRGGRKLWHQVPCGLWLDQPAFPHILLRASFLCARVSYLICSSSVIHAQWLTWTAPRVSSLGFLQHEIFKIIILRPRI
jgi:hypothetical protein